MRSHSGFFDNALNSPLDTEKQAAWQARLAAGQDVRQLVSCTVAAGAKEAQRASEIWFPDRVLKEDITRDLIRRIRPLQNAKNSVPVVGVLDGEAYRLDAHGERAWIRRQLSEQPAPVTVPKVLTRVDLETGEVIPLDVQRLRQMTPADVAPDVDSTESSARRSHRRRLYGLQDAAAKLAPDQRVCTCGKRQSGAGGVNVLVAQGRAYFDGVQTCGSVWHCPVCARKITELRRDDMQHMAYEIRGGGGQLLMLTITAPHTREIPLRDSKNAMTKAYRYLVSGKNALKNLFPGYLGTIRALEVTVGDNGWHVHFHVVVVLGAEISEDERAEIESAIYDRWVKAWKLHGTHGVPKGGEVAPELLPSRAHGVRLDIARVSGLDVDPVTDYVCKWGVAEESTKLHTKKSASGDTPWTLLEKFAQGDKKAGAMWREYAKVFKGGRQLVWSVGLRDLVGLGAEVPDEVAAAAEPEPDAIVTKLEPLEWLAVRCVGSRSAVLDLAERGPAVLALYLREVLDQFTAAGGRSAPEYARLAVRRCLLDFYDHIRVT